MASEPAGQATSEAEAGTASATFTLQIISPSVGIPQPLALQELPTDITVKQLKERIRNAVSLKPTDQAQRLIHRGRLLARDSETMTEVFGQETLRSTEPQTLHLVLRDFSDGQTTSMPTLHTANQIPAPSQPAGVQVPQHQHQHHHHHHHFQPQAQVRIGVPHHHGYSFGYPHGPVPGPALPGQQMNSPGITPQQYAQYMRAMNAHAGTLNQNQRTAMQGGQDIPTSNVRGTPGTSTPGRAASPFQPEASRTTVRESTGPNGNLQWRITFNETFYNPMQRPGRTGSPLSTTENANSRTPQTWSVPNGAQLSGNDVQNIMQAADASSATRVMTDAMRRNASSSSLANLATSQAHHPIPPGVTTPMIPSRAGSATGTPDPLRAVGQTRSPPLNQPQTQYSQGTPEVYILSSPSGPRALLLNSSLETYFSPPIRTVNQPGMSFTPRLFPPGMIHSYNPQYMVPTATTHQPHTSPLGRGHVPNSQANTPQPQQQAQPQHGLPHPPQAQPQIGHAVARADNPQVQAIRLAQLWPHIWMVIRLGLFIWWFTSPTSSWSRWITVISIAITLFLVNTGLLNPLVDQFWVPFRRHLENLIPLADGHRRVAQPAARGENGDSTAVPGQQNQEPNPADAAARLVQRRRNANANWLMDQARRLERAGILFLASIAPGVAERHIAQMEAEVRAERRRQEAEAAAAAAAAAAEQSERPEGIEQGAEDGEPTAANGESGQPEQVAQDEGNERPPAAEEPLIVV
ncbi:hypothetical protein F4677DRAFT_437239 [Hypoxylon crocopeplum]|nr:hypothetical protein F4677DRAFT_437239 [Hypoxylon crocopeplum]